MKTRLALLALAGAMLACQVVPTPPALRSTPTRPMTPSALRATNVPLPTVVVPTSAVTSAAPGAMQPLPPIPAAFAPVTPIEWTAGHGVDAPQTPVHPGGPQMSPDAPANPEVLAGLGFRQRALLLQYGFVIVPGGEAQFAAVRARVADRFGQPYYLTGDAALQATAITVQELRLALEREELARRMILVGEAALDETLGYAAHVQGGLLEPDVRLAAVYLATGLRLLDPDLALPDAVAEFAGRQAAQVTAGVDVGPALLIPGYQDDFSAYIPRTPYAGDPALEAYYRGRMWFGRASLALDDPNAGRAALILTLALRQAQIASGPGIDGDVAFPAADEWARLADTLAFLEGLPAAYGPRQTAALMDQIFGRQVTIVGLADPGKWEQLRRLAVELGPVQLGGAAGPFGVEPPGGEGSTSSTRGWRWLPQGAAIDEAFFAYLAAFRHPTTPNGDVAIAPTALEFGVALGSPLAADLLAADPRRRAPEYLSALARADQALADDRPAAWRSSLDGLWLAGLRAQTGLKDAAFTPLQRSEAWSSRELAAALAAWVQMRTLPARLEPLPPNEAAARRPESAAPPAWVEPNPLLFYRLAYLTAALADGLEQRNLTGVFSTVQNPNGLRARLEGLYDLTDRLQRLGDIAGRELRGQKLGPDEWALIVAPLGEAEARSPQGEALPELPALLPLSAAGDGAAYAAVGRVNRLYVLVQDGESLRIAQGGVYAFYDFPQSQFGPIVNPADWSRLVATAPLPPPVWMQDLVLPEGAPVDVLGFHAGEVLRVKPGGDGLHLRAEPGRAAASLRRLAAGDTVTLLDGVTEASGLTWRQVRLPDGVEGWIVQDPVYYERI